eukprot:4263564-Pyramimonas_sp.AAC.1
MATPIQRPLRSWSDVCGCGLLFDVVVSLRGGGGGAVSYRILLCVSSKNFPNGVGGWTSGVS